ncbi:hypothetical protein HQ585_08740 [candidate division KSB1 bacterium]|nr:hypothetical protein [candidate division KSB1 bacterium]
MKLTPQEKATLDLFLPGTISKDGFLGDDSRHVHDIVQMDQRELTRLGIDQKDIADRMSHFIEAGKKGLETTVDLGDFTVQVQWQRGLILCPFGEKRRVPKLIAIVCNKKREQCIRYSQLNEHMIREHGFFEGSGSTFRLNPAELVQILEIQSSS